ncbi:30S ribosomal protein S4 [bacterium (Candidatus Howlettbacteria) CG_4_10_14_0_8_um_filter_40_9]|nr:MAG: 30S ribosomal protein S4 [bacterium (Candidatus Howlettbacteria) CG_4_10_14_0_8_um_filter_40_9]
MAKITNETCKLCRRERVKLFLKGERCLSPKCAVAKRPYPPGAHGQSRRSKLSDYAVSLREKQKVKRIYGVLEKQFRNYFEKADKKEGVTGEILLQYLEMRFDTIVKNMNFADSQRQARQIIGHGHFLINGKKVNISSYQMKPGDKVEVSEKSKKEMYFKELQSLKKDAVSWVSSDLAHLKGEVLGVPKRADLDPEIQEQLIVELYSK